MTCTLFDIILISHDKKIKVGKIPLKMDFKKDKENFT